MMDRRTFLAASGASLLAAACQPTATPAVGSRKISKVGLQTYTLRDAMADDFVGTFQMIKDVGYDYVELNGRNFANHSPTELRSILDDIGLPSPATHVDYNSLSEMPETLADVAATMGCHYVILPYLADDQRSLDDYKRHAAMLNTSSEILAKSGIKTAYHNHQFEFDTLDDGSTGMEILLSETEPSRVDFEIDLFWTALAQVDISALFASHPGRFKLCHIKDLAGDLAALPANAEYDDIVANIMVNVGEGQIPFETYFADNDISGMEYFIAEHDGPNLPYRTSIQTSHDAIRAMRF